MYVPFDLGADVVASNHDADVDVVIFPEFVEGEIGIYRANLDPLKKQLAEEGIRADYSHPPERRAWLRELSVAEVVLDIAIGLVSSGSVAVVQHLVTRRDPATKVKVKITTARKVRGRRMWDAEFVEFEGSADDVARQIEEWKKARNVE